MSELKEEKEKEGEAPQECIIVVRKDGPLRVFGKFTLTDAEGNVFELPERPGKNWVSLCRCGLSKEKPFCDGAHKEAGFKSEV